MTFRSCPSFFFNIFVKKERKAHRGSAIGRMAKKVLCDRLE